MNKPVIVNINEKVDTHEMEFTLSNVDVCIANAIRRTLLTNIDTVVFRTSPHEKNDAHIEINTSRLNNEIIKQRLSCIPIHLKDHKLCENLELHINVQNSSKDVQYVTSEHFKIYDTLNQTYLNKEAKEIFPPNKYNKYIDFVRLRPQISDNLEIPGEELKMTCKMCVSNAKENAMFNVVCNSSYGFTIDSAKVKQMWKLKENELSGQNINKGSEQYDFAKRDFELLEAKRCFKTDKFNRPNSFDFNIQSVGVYTCYELLNKACLYLMQDLDVFIENVSKNHESIIYESNVNILHSYDVLLKEKDATFGKILEYALYTNYYESDVSSEEKLTYCGYLKKHPHDDFCIIRLAFNDDKPSLFISELLKKSCLYLKKLFMIINDKFIE